MGGRDLHFAAFRDAPEERLDPLLQQVIPDIPGKTLTAVQVVFPPVARSTPNRHRSAFLYAYVLAGEIRSQIEGQPSRVFRRGESWTEKPGSHHLLTENVSRTAPARLLVVFVANTGESLKTDDRVEERPDVPARAGMRFGHGDQRIAAWAHSLQEVDSCSFGAGSERLEHVCDDLHGRKVG